MKRYEKPEIKVTNYSINENIMAGDIDGDINTNPWADLFTTAATSYVDAGDADLDA